MPTENEVFTDAGTDWHNRAMIGFMPGVHWGVYVEGYKEAADRLVAGINAGQGSQDFLVFPILHLYRHYLELSLKANIRMCQLLLDIPRPSLKEAQKSKENKIMAAQGHDLVGLWQYLQELLPRIHPKLAQISGLARMVSGFAGLDPSGDQTRYPITLDGAPALAGLTAVNLRQLADDMGRAEEVFAQIEGAIDCLIDQREYQREMELEMEAEFRSWNEY